MPKQARSKQPRPAPPSGKRAGTTRNAQAAQGQLAMAVREIEKAMGDIQRGLALAERRIEADARQRIRSLKKEGRAQMRALRGEATRCDTPSVQALGRRRRGSMRLPWGFAVSRRVSPPAVR